MNQTVPKEKQVVDLPHKDFKKTVLKILKELKQGMENVKKTMNEHKIETAIRR